MVSWLRGGPRCGFATFLRGVTPIELKTSEIPRGVVPTMAIHILVPTLVWFWDEI